MTEPRDDEAGREALLRAMGRVLVELSYKPNDLTHEVLREAAEELRATLAPPAATAPSEPPRDEAVTAHSSTSDACGQIALATFMARTEAQGREARTRFFADLRAPNAPRDEAAALLREAREVLERYAVGWTDDGRSFDNVAVIAMRARIDAYLRALAAAPPAPATRETCPTCGSPDRNNPWSKCHARITPDLWHAAPASPPATDARWRWIESLFERKWGGTIGCPPTWHLRGDFRHVLAGLKGDTLGDAIDAMLAALGPAPSEPAGEVSGA
jgi:hypothetical protein